MSNEQRPDPIAFFLRKVLEQNNDCAPTILLSPDADQGTRAKMDEFARRLDEMGLIESSGPRGWDPGGDLLRVRVTDEGMDYLDNPGR